MVEAHPHPELALTDAAQALPCAQLADLAAKLRAVALAVKPRALAS